MRPAAASAARVHDEEEKKPDDAAQGDTPDDFPTAADTPDGGAAVRPQRRAERG